MPRFIRPSFLEARVDGRKSIVRTGPRRKDGSMHVEVYIKYKGEIRTLFSLDLHPIETNEGWIQKVRFDSDIMEFQYAGALQTESQ